MPPLAAEDQLQSPSQINANDSPIRLHQIGQWPTSPKPLCSDPNCEGFIYVSPVQYQSAATIVFHINGRDVTLTGCRCCPLLYEVWCSNHDCRAPTGTRQSVSDELGGCACETSEDLRERYQRQLEEEDFVPAEGEVQEDFIDIDDDDNDVFPMLLTGAVMERFNVSTSPSQTLQEQEGYPTGTIVLPTLGFDQQQFHVARDAQVDVLASF